MAKTAEKKAKKPSARTQPVGMAAKTAKNAAKKASTRTRPAPKPDVAASSTKPLEWSTDALTRALNATSPAEDVELLKRAGILTKGGKLAKRYKSWGDKVSRTPEINEAGEMQE